MHRDHEGPSVTSRLGRGGGIFDRVQQTWSVALPYEIGRACARGYGHLRPQRAIFEQLLNAIGEGHWITDRNDKALFPVPHHASAIGRRDHGHAASERFQVHERETVRDRRNDEQVRRAEFFSHPGARNLTDVSWPSKLRPGHYGTTERTDDPYLMGYAAIPQDLACRCEIVVSFSEADGAHEMRPGWGELGSVSHEA